MKDPAFAKLVVFVNAAVPCALLVWDAYWHQLGANPVNFALRTSGMCALVFLLLSLTVTPLRLATGQNWLSNFRRMLGLYAFFYGSAHFLLYVILDRELNWSEIIQGVTKQPYIIAGSLSLLLMLPLALTSTAASIKRLGAARWKRVHQLAYVSAMAGVVHYYWLVKADIRQPVAFAVALFVLLIYRVLVARFPSLKRSRVHPSKARANIPA